MARRPPALQAGDDRGAPRLQRVLLAALIALLALNVWTGGPLLALWVGSRVQGSGPPTMGSVFVVIGLLAAVSVLLVRALTRLGHAYDQLTGRPATVRRHTPWLRSMRGERPQHAGTAAHLTVLERTLVVMVVLAVALFEIWFFFFSGSPIDNRSGRASAEAALARSGPAAGAPAASVTARRA